MHKLSLTHRLTRHFTRWLYWEARVNSQRMMPTNRWGRMKQRMDMDLLAYLTKSIRNSKARHLPSSGPHFFPPGSGSAKKTGKHRPHFPPRWSGKPNTQTIHTTITLRLTDQAINCFVTIDARYKVGAKRGIKKRPSNQSPFSDDEAMDNYLWSNLCVVHTREGGVHTTLKRWVEQSLPNVGSLIWCLCIEQANPSPPSFFQPVQSTQPTWKFPW